MSETGKIEYSPDYKSKRPAAEVLRECGAALNSAWAMVRKEESRAAELSRLKEEVVKAAKARRAVELEARNRSLSDINGLRFWELDQAFKNAVDALIAFEDNDK